MISTASTLVGGPFRTSLLERLPRASIVHHVAGQGRIWASRGRQVLVRESGTWRRVASFPRCLPRDLFGFSRPTARASRADKCNLFENSAGRVLGIRAHTAYALADGRMRRLGDIRGDCVLHGGIAEDEAGWTCFGEYFRNPQRQSVRIWRVSSDLARIEIAHEFPDRSIRHVHCVLRDPYDPQALWVTVGDYKDECYLMRTADRFQSLSRFGDGTQTWRAVMLFFTPHHVCWLTDSHLEQNHACRMDRRTGELEIGQPISCSAWYGTTTTDGLYVAFTTVEPGPAIHSHASSILVSTDAFQWHEAGTFEKDGWRPWKLFKYGVISCPSGPMPSSDLYISGEGLIGLDGVSMRLSIEPGAPAP